MRRYSFCDTDSMGKFEAAGDKVGPDCAPFERPRRAPTTDVVARSLIVNRVRKMRLFQKPSLRRACNGLP